VVNINNIIRKCMEIVNQSVKLMSKTTILNLYRMSVKFCFMIMILCNFIYAQEKERTEEQDISPLEKKGLSVVQQPGVPLESTIDPEKYFVGPSDIISVNIWMSPPINFTLTVSPEGTLIIPTVGEVQVAELTLAKAKEKILLEARKKYLAVDVTATLIKPRPIIVTVTGSVLKPGLFTLTAVDRVHKVLEEANKPSQSPPEMSMRNIVLKHNDGLIDRVDLVKFLATKDDKWNPYLREGDVVIVPRKNQIKNVIGIYGEVNSPGRYEFVEGDSLHDIFEIGMGFTRLAMKDSVEFTRLNIDGTILTPKIIDLLNGTQPDFKLEPGDRIVVKAKKELREDYRVHISGEVAYPGTYPITKNRTKLSEVISQAGGFTEFAALKSAELNRRSVQASDVEIERLLSSRGGVSAEDSLDYYLETELRLRKEIVNVDFEKLFMQSDSAQDVILQGEDYIFVPSVKKTIYIFGQVVSPGHIPFVQGKTAEYYVKKGGGFTERARKGDMKIIKGKNKQWLAPDETTIEDGDYVWIPKDPERPFSYYMTIASQAATVLSVIISMALVFRVVK
jgi:polysaccharide export outer membrane protein